MAFAPGCFFGLLSAGFSRGGNFAEFQKMRAEGVLAKFAIARLYGHLGSRRLLQNVVLCWFAAKTCAMLALQVHFN